MKKIVFIIIPALICGIVFTGCSKDDLIEYDTYSGTYTMTDLSSWVSSYSGAIRIELKNGKYTCTGLLHNQSEFSGDYLINDNKIIFDVKVWKTDYIDENGNRIMFNFDTRIVPQGEWSYSLDGNKLKLLKVYDDFAHCEYDLEREWFTLHVKLQSL